MPSRIILFIEDKFYGLGLQNLTLASRVMFSPLGFCLNYVTGYVLLVNNSVTVLFGFDKGLILGTIRVADDFIMFGVTV